MRVGQAAAADTRSPCDRASGRGADGAPTVARACAQAKPDAALLLIAERGAGADALARALHEQGPCGEGPFVVVDCRRLRQQADSVRGGRSVHHATLPESVRAARDGTLYLDDISELSLEQQSDLLRPLGSEAEPPAENTCRSCFCLIASTSRDLRHEVQAGRFRKDLFQRIAGTSIRVMPLRERVEDLPALVSHFCAAVTARLNYAPKRFAPEVLEVFRSHAWPGNLRELCEVVEAMVMHSHGDEIGLGTLPPDWVGATLGRAS